MYGTTVSTQAVIQQEKTSALLSKTLGVFQCSYLILDPCMTRKSVWSTVFKDIPKKSYFCSEDRGGFLEGWWLRKYHPTRFTGNVFLIGQNICSSWFDTAGCTDTIVTTRVWSHTCDLTNNSNNSRCQTPPIVETLLCLSHRQVSVDLNDK